METTRTIAQAATVVRPSIGSYEDPVDFMKAMIDYRKRTERGFSVQGATASLRRVSPALVSLILARKRKITVDRVDEFARLLALRPEEKIFFKNWIARGEAGIEAAPGTYGSALSRHQRREVSTHILNDWINVYVKDCFQIPAVQKNSDLVCHYLAAYAQPKRLRKAVDFLVQEGHLRRTLDGRIVVETNLAVADPKVPSTKIRQFHKGALGVAKTALDVFAPSERLANTLVIPLNEKSHRELVDLIQEFSDRLQEFAARNEEVPDRLYQLIINLSPAGGKVE